MSQQRDYFDSFIDVAGINKKKEIVVIGGGTGTHTVLSGLKKFVPDVSLKAVITMADSGGSTGRLRDEFGYLPVGDVRMALTALASEAPDHEELLRQLFLYRFDKGGDLSGHSFGNLFLVALTDILGSEEEAIRVASRVLRIKGEVIPVTTDDVHLVAEYADGVVVEGETHIDEPESSRDTQRIVNFYTTPKGTVTDAAKHALAHADVIVLGPGDLYTSVLATCVVDDVARIIQESPAKLTYVSNLMTKFGQTNGMGLSHHVKELTKYIKRNPDFVMVNTTTLPPDLLKQYKKEGEYPIVDDGDTLDTRVIRGDFLASEEVITQKGDTLKRSLIRHDSKKLAKAIIKLESLAK